MPPLTTMHDDTPLIFHCTSKQRLKEGSAVVARRRGFGVYAPSKEY